MSFFYQNYVKNVINCVNFSIKSRETIALAGENGSGKSPIVKLSARLYGSQWQVVIYNKNGTYFVII